METYMGVVIVQAEPIDQLGFEGFLVKNSIGCGIPVWIPKDTFDRQYLPIDDATNGTITGGIVENFISTTKAMCQEDNSLSVECETITGYIAFENCSDIDPLQKEKEEEMCKQHVRNRIRKYLEFVLQWGKYGIQRKRKPS